MPWLIALVAGGIGAFAFWRRRRRPESDVSPADELKAKLAESRATSEEPAPEAEAEPELESDLDARRQEVHERARGAIDELS